VRKLPQEVLIAALGAMLVGVVLGLVMAGPRAAVAQRGDAAPGAAVFTAKQCGRCHLPEQRGRGQGPPLEALRRPQGAYELAGRLWNHVPAMFTAFGQDSVPWPVIDPTEMSDLMVYLGADPARDPAPDRLRGQVLLLKKECLKCHRYRGEGGALAPDLAERRDDYRPAHVWASRIWAHTPRMAAVALGRGVLYPRFADDEMAHLIGFLRTGEWAR
jgi:mono/diheme cytochrome c family protein